MDLRELTAHLHTIRDRNNWRQFHSLKDLAVAASVGMAELVKIFQWLTENQSRMLSAEQLEHASQEVDDIVLYLLLFCGKTGFDLEQVVRARLADCERRFLPRATAISTNWRRILPKRSMTAPGMRPASWYSRPTSPRPSWSDLCGPSISTPGLTTCRSG